MTLKFHLLLSCRDLNKISDGIGHKIGLFIQAMTMFLAGFAMGFAYGWKLTLVILAVAPLLAVAGGIVGKVCRKS